MRMKIKILPIKAIAHITHSDGHLRWAHHTEGIRQHQMADVHPYQTLDQAVYIIPAIAVTVGPVLQINIDQQAPLMCIPDGALDILQVGIKGLAQLLSTVFFTALGQQIEHPATGTNQPINATPMIGEPQHFNPIQTVMAGRPVMDPGNGFFFAVRYPSRGNLDTIHLETVQQRPCDADFLIRRERDPLGLLPVPQGGIHQQHMFSHQTSPGVPVDLSKNTILYR